MATWAELGKRHGSSNAKPLKDGIRHPAVQKAYDASRDKLRVQGVTLHDSLVKKFPVLEYKEGSVDGLCWHLLDTNTETNRKINRRKSKTRRYETRALSLPQTSTTKKPGCRGHGVFVRNPFPYHVLDTHAEHWIYWIPLNDKRRIRTIMLEDLYTLVDEWFDINQNKKQQRKLRDVNGTKSTPIVQTTIESDVILPRRNNRQTETKPNQVSNVPPSSRVIMFQNGKGSRSVASIRHIHVFLR